MGIEVIYLFGSYVQGFKTPLSDIDIGVVFAKPEKYQDNTLEVYNKLYDVFTDIFPNTKEVDIVFLQFTPISLQFNAIKDGEIIYESNSKARFCYQESVLKKYLDLKYFYNLRYKAILTRI